jgi:hypothetical protein
MRVERGARESGAPEDSALDTTAPRVPAHVALTGMTPTTILALQRTAGNAAVGRALGRAVLARDLNSDYESAVNKPDWQHAAELLNSLTREEIVARLGKRSVAEVAQLHHAALVSKKLGPTSLLAQLTPPLLTAFSRQFRDAAELVRLSPEAIKVVAAAETASVKYGGYAEDGPRKDPWPYTILDTVFIPKAHTDKVRAMAAFIYELNNAMHEPVFEQIFKDADTDKVSAKQYARRIVTQEIESLLSEGKVWAETKRLMGSGKDLDKYDADVGRAEYEAVRSGKMSKDDLVTNALARVYPSGADAGKTVEQTYVEQYNARKARRTKGKPKD